MPSYSFSSIGWALGCGVTGSLAGLFAKVGLGKYDKPFGYLDNPDVALILLVFCKLMMFVCWAWSNIKMIEFKIRSFAMIGASHTVIIAFASNYLLSCVYEIFLNNGWINGWQFFGFLIILAGVCALQKADEKA
jgi:hypothetical protein